jgi:predicted membrane-bound spermidine synthase
MKALVFSGETVLKTILITGSTGMVVGFTGTLLTLFGGGSIRVEYLEFAVALLLFLVMLIGAYWFVIGEPGTREERQPMKKRRFLQ